MDDVSIPLTKGMPRTEEGVNGGWYSLLLLGNFWGLTPIRGKGNPSAN